MSPGLVDRRPDGDEGRTDRVSDSRFFRSIRSRSMTLTIGGNG